MDPKIVRRQELLEAAIDDPIAGGLIDDFYTDFDLDDGDRECLERFLQSSDLGVRREALIALMFSTPKFTGYARDGLLLHILGVIEDSETMYTGVSVLAELSNRGDAQAAEIPESLKSNPRWNQEFWDVRIRKSLTDTEAPMRRTWLPQRTPTREES